MIKNKKQDIGRPMHTVIHVLEMYTTNISQLTSSWLSGNAYISVHQAQLVLGW